MITDEILANLWVTPKCDGDIWLRNGGTQKFLAVGVHSLVRNRSTTVHCSQSTNLRKKIITQNNHQ